MDSSLCTLGHVQEREFWQLLEEVLGRSYGRALAHDQVLDRLGGMTAVDALGAGEEPRRAVSKFFRSRENVDFPRNVGYDSLDRISSDHNGR